MNVFRAVDRFVDRFWDFVTQRNDPRNAKPAPRFLRFVGYSGVLLGGVVLAVSVGYALQGEVIPAIAGLVLVAFFGLFARDAFRAACQATGDHPTPDSPD